MKKILISIFAVFALTVGLFLPTVANRKISAKADSSASINDDTVNYEESIASVGDTITDKWFRISASASLNTTNMVFSNVANNLVIRKSTGGDFRYNDIIVKSKFGVIDVYIPQGITLELLGATFSLDEELLTEPAVTLVAPSEPRDVISGTTLAWQEKDLNVGDTISGKWLRFYNQNQSGTSAQYGLQLTENIYCCNYNNNLTINNTNSTLSKNFTLNYTRNFGVIDVFIPLNLIAFYKNTLDGQYYTVNFDNVTVTSVNTNYVKALEAPVVEEPDEPIATPEKPVKVEYVNKSDALPAGYKPLKAGDVITSGTIAVYRDSDDDFDVAYMRSTDNNVFFFPAMPGGCMLYGAWNGAEDLNSVSIIDAEYLDINYDTWNIIAVEDFGEITILEGEKTIYYKPDEINADVESIVESNDIVQSATDWINSTLGLSLSTGALIVILVILFVIFKK